MLLEEWSGKALSILKASRCASPGLVLSPLAVAFTGNGGTSAVAAVMAIVMPLLTMVIKHEISGHHADSVSSLSKAIPTTPSCAVTLSTCAATPVYPTTPVIDSPGGSPGHAPMSSHPTPVHPHTPSTPIIP